MIFRLFFAVLQFLLLSTSFIAAGNSCKGGSSAGRSRTATRPTLNLRDFHSPIRYSNTTSSVSAAGAACGEDSVVSAAASTAGTRKNKRPAPLKIPMSHCAFATTQALTKAESPGGTRTTYSHLGQFFVTAAVAGLRTSSDRRAGKESPKVSPAPSPEPCAGGGAETTHLASSKEFHSTIRAASALPRPGSWEEMLQTAQQRLDEKDLNPLQNFLDEGDGVLEDRHSEMWLKTRKQIVETIKILNILRQLISGLINDALRNTRNQEKTLEALQAIDLEYQKYVAILTQVVRHAALLGMGAEVVQDFRAATSIVELRRDFSVYGNFTTIGNVTCAGCLASIGEARLSELCSTCGNNVTESHTLAVTTQWEQLHQILIVATDLMIKIASSTKSLPLGPIHPTWPF